MYNFVLKLVSLFLNFAIFLTVYLIASYFLRACQRRALALFKDKKRPEMNPIVEAENLLNSPFIKRYFKKFRDRMCDGKFDRKELVVAFIYLVYYLFKNSNLISSQGELIRR